MQGIPRDIRDRLLDYALGQLPPEAAAGIEEQLPANPPWVRFIDRARRMIAPLDLWPAPPVPADLVGRTLRAVREHDRERNRRSAPARPRRHLTFALLEVVAVAASVVLVAFLLLPSLHNAQVASLEKDCQVNLREIGEAMAAFWGGRGEGHLPRLGAVADAGGWNQVGRDRDEAEPAGGRSNTRSLWVLVREGLIAPKYFLCPLTGDRVDPTPAEQFSVKQDFADGRAISYSYQVCLGPRTEAAPAGRGPLPILADRGPMFAADGTPTAASPRQNSPNHGGRGQYALLSDLSTVAWLGSPDLQVVGGSDSLWTPDGHAAGAPMTGREIPATDHDILLGP
jgi:hypothetical protein